MHDAVLRRAEEVCRAAETVQHTATHNAGAVCMGVDVYFDGRVHADDAQSSDDLRRVGHLL